LHEVKAGIGPGLRYQTSRGIRNFQRENGGAEGIRTLDLLDAIEARSQLRHGPTGKKDGYAFIAPGGGKRQTGGAAAFRADVWPGRPEGSRNRGKIKSNHAALRPKI
jgi:hypothetical protein